MPPAAPGNIVDKAHTMLKIAVGILAIVAGPQNPASAASATITPLVTARRERQTHMHRQSVGRSVFRLDGPAHGLDIATCDR